MIPRITIGPVQLKHQSKIMLQCQFNASTLPEVTIVVWKRNNIPLSNSSLYNINIYTPEHEEQVVTTLTINSSDYYGTYTCYCYYNSNLVTSSKSVISNQNSLTLDPDQES